MSYDPKNKRGSNPDGSTSPADIAKLVAYVRRNAAKNRRRKDDPGPGNGSVR